MPAIFRARGLLACALGLAAAAACGSPDIKSDLDTEGPPEVNIVTVTSETLGEVATFCRDTGSKNNELYCSDEDEDGTLDTFQITNAPPLAWQVRVVFSELLEADLVEELIRDEEGVVLGGTIANTRPVTVDCGGADTDLAYGGFYDPSGNHLTDPPGPSLVVEFADFVATGTPCAVTLKADIIRDKDGQSVPSALSGPYQFSIAALRRVSNQPQDLAENIALDTIPSIRFNAPVAQASLGNLITIEDITDPQNPVAVAVTLVSDEETPFVDIEPDSDLLPDRCYLVTVNGGLTDIEDSPLVLDEPFTYSFSTAEESNCPDDM